MFMVIDFSFLLQCGGSVCLEAFNIIQALSGDYMASLDTLGGECWMEMLVFEICEHFCVFSFICSEDWHSCWDLLFLNVFYFNMVLWFWWIQDCMICVTICYVATWTLTKLQIIPADTWATGK